MSKKCKLCGKTFNNKNYQLFGTSCFKTICELLNIVIPKSIKEKDNDKYKKINEQENKTKTQKVISSVKNGLGYTLNNMALTSVQYGVLKEYNVKISFNMYNYGKEGD